MHLFLQSLESRAFKAYLLQTSQLEIEILNCSTSRNMTNQLQEHIIGIPVSCQYDKPSPPNGSGAIIPKKMNSMNYRMNNNRKKADNFVDGVREHVRLGLKFSETVKGKLSLGARILQIGGVKRVFKAKFWLNSFSFVQVSIPLRKIKRANQGENVKKPSQKYMEIVTMDNFDFWFGILEYQKAFSYLRQAISQVQKSSPEVIQVNKFFPPASTNVNYMNLMKLCIVKGFVQIFFC
ncbi:GEM-like protein 4 [Vitis vinifera]|uniref:GEM-like protein 4 n=1 Tax=Vitis vinifera TaxID=29760 RepID=A0A438HDP2_VITVI|nr:GEM-like protein 4 [Vitis vinifera]